jgi:hypothetical protein
MTVKTTKFWVHTAMIMMITISWGLPPCSLADRYPVIKVHNFTFQETVLFNNNANLPLEKVTYNYNSFWHFMMPNKSGSANHNKSERI